MQTRFTSLVTIKKNIVQKNERLLQNANADLNSALIALELSKSALRDIDAPKNGFMSGFLASRSLVEAARNLIKHNQEWIDFAKKQVSFAKENLKFAMIEYEKFNYLEVEEIKKIIDKQKKLESKELDEVALITYSRDKSIQGRK